MMSGRARGKIRAPRKGLTASSGDSVDFEEIWGSLSESLREIHTKNASKLSFEQLYRHGYKLVLKKKGELLYNQVLALERDWLQNVVAPEIFKTISSALVAGMTGGAPRENTNSMVAAGQKFMKALDAAWRDYILCMAMTVDVLMYMDRVYCADNHKPLLYPASMALFRQFVVQSSIPEYPGLTVQDLLYSVILSQIEMAREGDWIESQSIKSCVIMLEGLYEDEREDESTKLYLTSFEPRFLQLSAQFYRQEGQRMIETMDAGSFCTQAMDRLREESERCDSMLSTLTKNKVREVLETNLIKEYLPQVIRLPGSGVKFMLDNDRVDDLEKIYKHSARVDPNKTDLRNEVQKRIIELGTEINEAASSDPQQQPKTAAQANGVSNGESKAPAAEKPINAHIAAAIKWVDDVLTLKERFDTVLNQAFGSDTTLQTAFTKSFTEFINMFSRSSEFLSLFFDENMKKGIKGKTENEVDQLLDKGITLLRYIQDKDMFERYYKRHLSRRLLMKRSVSMDAERQMISKMKMEVGNTFTQRIEAMFRDMSISEDLTTSYKEHVAGLGAVDKKRAELEINVLTSTMWPLEAMNSVKMSDEEATPQCAFPSSMERLRQGFEQFYLDKHSGRKLTWQPNMGTADIRAYFSKTKGTNKMRELNVSTYAMVILLMFNDLPSGESITCEEIYSRTNIPMHDLTRNLQSLAVAQKTRVLIKEPMSKDVKLTDKFYFNESFHSPYAKVKIGVVSNSNRVEDTEERKATEKKNDEARAAVIEAAIVRTMKQRKTLTHQDLIVQVIEQLNSRFSPEIPMVKKRIESLIEREYLERQEEVERPAYRYLA